MHHSATARNFNGENKEIANADFILTGASVLFDAVYVPGGEASVAALKSEPEA